MEKLEAATSRYCISDTSDSTDVSPLLRLALAFKDAGPDIRARMAADVSLREGLLDTMAAQPSPAAAVFRLLRNLVAVNPSAAASHVATAAQTASLARVLAQPEPPLSVPAATAAWQMLANTMAGADEEGARLRLFEVLTPAALDVALRPGSEGAIATCGGLIVYNFALHEAGSLSHLLDTGEPGHGRHVLRRTLLLMERKQPHDDSSSSAASEPTQWAWLMTELLAGGPRFGDAYQTLGMLSQDEGDKGEGEAGAGAATVTVSGNAPQATRATLESAEGVMARTAILKFIEARTGERAGADRIALSRATVTFLLERCHLLAYLAQDEAWWRNAQHAARGLQLALVVRILANVSIHGAGAEMSVPDIMRAAERAKTITAVTDLLREMLPWQQRATPVKSAEGPRPKDPTPMGFKSDLLRLAANLLHRSPENQKQVLAAKGVAVYLSCFLHDDHHPLMREWAVMAVRNLCEGNAEAQAEIASYQRQPEAAAAAATPDAQESLSRAESELEREIGSIRIEIDEMTGLARPAPGPQ